MKQNCFSVFDKRTVYFMLPFFSPTLASGKRLFMDAVRNPDALPHKYPEDFELYHIGVFDDETGELTPIKPVPLMSATEVKVAIPTDYSMEKN